MSVEAEMAAAARQHLEQQRAWKAYQDAMVPPKPAPPKRQVGSRPHWAAR